MILGNLIGVMALWGVTVNALWVLNFVMAIGITVKFCILFIMAFMYEGIARLLRGPRAGERRRQRGGGHHADQAGGVRTGLVVRGRCAALALLLPRTTAIVTEVHGAVLLGR